ncbi:MAG: hypothetical protein WCI43_08530 [Candidatus Firestonebacteria bacterium]
MFREWEAELRRKIIWWENFRDDNTVEPEFWINWDVKISDYGVPSVRHRTSGDGSFVWDSPIKDLDKDFDKLKMRTYAVDRKKTEETARLANEIFGDLLPSRIIGSYWWTLGLTQDAIFLVGLENLMLYMYDNPEGVHRLMAYLRDNALKLVNWVEKEKLLTHWNKNQYVGSGGVAYTDELPQKDWKEGMSVRLKDRWGFAESQETVEVSPEQFGEFVFPYQLPLLSKFGLNCYGCCEPVDKRLKYILQIPNLRRVSVSPWANQDICAEKLKGIAVFSRKPNPSLLSASFNEDELRKDLRSTLEAAKSIRNQTELIMKDTHTCGRDIARFTKWVKLAYEEVGT